MQSSTHESLFRRLLDITSRIKTAICDGDAEALKLLAGEHNCVMDELNRAGFSKDPDLLDLVREAHDQVGEVIGKIRKRRDEIGRELRTFCERKRMSGAYAKNAGPATMHSTGV